MVIMKIFLMEQISIKMIFGDGFYTPENGMQIGANVGTFIYTPIRAI